MCDICAVCVPTSCGPGFPIQYPALSCSLWHFERYLDTGAVTIWPEKCELLIYVNWQATSKIRLNISRAGKIFRVSNVRYTRGWGKVCCFGITRHATISKQWTRNVRFILSHQLPAAVAHHWTPKSHQSKHCGPSGGAEHTLAFPANAITPRVGERDTYIIRSACVGMLFIIAVDWL